MPDKRIHRGPHPDDAELFGPVCVPTLRAAMADYVTTDSVILDHCHQWVNLAAALITAHIPQARIVNLGCSIS